MFFKGNNDKAPQTPKPTAAAKPPAPPAVPTATGPAPVAGASLIQILGQVVRQYQAAQAKCDNSTAKSIELEFHATVACNWSEMSLDDRARFVQYSLALRDQFHTYDRVDGSAKSHALFDAAVALHGVKNQYQKGAEGPKSLDNKPSTDVSSDSSLLKKFHQAVDAYMSCMFKRDVAGAKKIEAEVHQWMAEKLKTISQDERSRMVRYAMALRTLCHVNVTVDVMAQSYETFAALSSAKKVTLNKPVAQPNKG